MGGYWRLLPSIAGIFTCLEKLVPISLLGDKGGYMSDCVGGCQKSFVCGIDAGGFCDVLFRVIMTYLIDIDLQNDVCLGLFC